MSTTKTTQPVIIGHREGQEQPHQWVEAQDRGRKSESHPHQEVPSRLSEAPNLQEPKETNYLHEAQDPRHHNEAQDPGHHEAQEPPHHEPQDPRFQEVKDTNKLEDQDLNLHEGEPVHLPLKPKEILPRFKSVFPLPKGEKRIDILSDAIQKAEELSERVANQPDLEPDARKTLEDISALLSSAQQVGRSRGLEDRLKFIYEESQKAFEASSHVPSTKVAAQKVVEAVKTWRPLFYLILSSREFRQLIVDSVSITRKVVFSYTAPILEETSQKLVEGAPKIEIAKTVKERAKETIEERKDLQELSDAEWDAIQSNIQGVLAILAKEPTYQQGIEKLFTLLDMFQKTKVPTIKVPVAIHLNKVVKEAEDIVASFSGTEALENFKYYIQNLILKVQKDEEIQQYLIELKEWVLKAKSEEEIRSEEFKRKCNELAHRGRYLMKDDEDLKAFLRSVDEMMENIKNDEFLQILRHHAGIVQSDLSYVDPEGQVHIDTDMLSKLQKALLPVITDAFKEINIPRLEYFSEETDFWADNLVLFGNDVMPENINFHIETDTDVSLQNLRDIEVKDNQTYLVITLDRLFPVLKDLEFYYHKKTIPHFEEKGKATFRVKGDGVKISFNFQLSPGPGKVTRITEGYTSFHISDMDVDFDTDSLEYHHDILVPMMTTLFKRQIRKKLEQLVEKNLNPFVNIFGQKMSEALETINKPILSGVELAQKAVKSTLTSY